MLQGGYPRIYDTRMPLNLFFSNYIDTYIERDVSEYLDVRNLAEFRRFLTLCALSSGALINYTNIANELGVSPRTVKAWMSILESSYIAFHLMPFYTNARKQVVKTPKLYFYDTGLLCHLLGIRTVEALVAHPKFGDIFENLIIAETMKQHLNANQEPQLFSLCQPHASGAKPRVDQEIAPLTDRQRSKIASNPKNCSAYSPSAEIKRNTWFPSNENESYRPYRPKLRLTRQGTPLNTHQRSKTTIRP